MKGKIVNIKGFLIQLPDVPDDKSQILFSQFPKSEQYWRRTKLSQYFYDFIPYAKKGDVKTKTFQAETFYDEDGRLVSLNERDSLMVQQELRTENYRRQHGVYAMMNGNLVWISPDYYYILQWCQMKDLPQKFGHYRRIQNEVLTVYWWARDLEVKWITAMFIPKCKKSGITQIFSGAFLNEGSYLEGAELLAASKEYPHVVDVFMSYYFHSYDNLPMIMKPMEKKRNLHEIIFGKPAKTSIAAGITGTFLNSKVQGTKTKATCFDGPVVKRGFVDEFPKWWEASKVRVKKAWMKMIETVKLQQKKNGILVLPSYMPETDDEGFREYKELCSKSDLSLRDPVTGQTPTGGIVFPITAIESNEDCFDIYGECDMIKAAKLVEDEYNSKTSLEDKQAHRRQYPTCWNDMFDSGGRGKTFDNLRLGIQAREVEKQILTGILPYRLGNVRWENSIWEIGAKENRRPKGKFGKVYFDELSEEDRMIMAYTASMKVFQDLPNELTNVAITNNIRDIDNGDYCTELNNSMVASFDPSDYALKSDVAEYSQNASHGGFVPDPALEARGIRTNELVFEYFFRHEDPDDTLEDVVKIILFFNCMIIIEANKKWLVTAIKKEGLQNFLLLKQADGTIRPYEEGDENDLVNSTTDMKEAYCRAINRYWYKPKSKDDRDWMGTCKSLTCLQQHMDFEILNTKKYDLVISHGYWRLAVESYTVYITEKRANDEYDEGALKETFATLVG